MLRWGSKNRGSWQTEPNSINQRTELVSNWAILQTGKVNPQAINMTGSGGVKCKQNYGTTNSSGQIWDNPELIMSLVLYYAQLRDWW